jgi:hypothetical protein
MLSGGFGYSCTSWNAECLHQCCQEMLQDKVDGLKQHLLVYMFCKVLDSLQEALHIFLIAFQMVQIVFLMLRRELHILREAVHILQETFHILQEMFHMLREQLHIVQDIHHSIIDCKQSQQGSDAVK